MLGVVGLFLLVALVTAVAFGVSKLPELSHRAYARRTNHLTRSIGRYRS
jgi:hypothetical protein